VRLTDGIVTIRTPEPDDTPALIATRDDQFRRFMGDGADDPTPTGCIVVGGEVVGWVDFDRDEREWLTHDDVNIGYGLHPDARGRGYATRAVKLLVSHLSRTTDVQTATLLIDPENRWSLGLAERAGFGPRLDLNGQAYFRRSVPPLTYTDGEVTIRLRVLDDVDAHVAGTDEEQIRWLWPEHRDDWLAMSPEQRIVHVRGVMERNIAINETGPKWDFGVLVDGALVGHVDTDLACPHVTPGDANISYTTWPQHRGQGHAAAAARLAQRFLRDHTGAREAHIVVEVGNEASLRVAHAAGAVTAGRYIDHQGKTMIRHVIRL
jgi:RimJ/RimL family protein N-acetyltransferase